MKTGVLDYSKPETARLPHSRFGLCGCILFLAAIAVFLFAAAESFAAFYFANAKWPAVHFWNAVIDVVPPALLITGVVASLVGMRRCTTRPMFAYVGIWSNGVILAVIFAVLVTSR